MSLLAEQRGAVNDEPIPFGLPPGDESIGGCTAVNDAALVPEDVGSSEPLPGLELVDVANLLDMMEAERQALLSDPRIADAKVKLLATADAGKRGAMFGVYVWLHEPRQCFYGEGASLADASTDALLTASVEHERAKRQGKAVSANG